MSNRYITDRFLPDKAIDLIDEAAARLRKEVDSKPEALDELVREEYGLPEGSGPFTLFVASDSRFVGQMESWDHMMHEEEEGGLEPGYYLYLKTGELYYIDEYGGKLVKL